jgi:hypothetical protein
MSYPQRNPYVTHGKTRQTLLNEGVGVENAQRLALALALSFAVVVVLMVLTALVGSL